MCATKMVRGDGARREDGNDEMGGRREEGEGEGGHDGPWDEPWDGRKKEEETSMVQRGRREGHGDDDGGESATC